MPEHELAYSLRHTQPRASAASLPFTGNVADWLRWLEVATPFDPERIHDLDRWRQATAEEHGHAFVSLLSVADALHTTLRPKAPLEVCFPRRRRQGSAHLV